MADTCPPPRPCADFGHRGASLVQVKISQRKQRQEGSPLSVKRRPRLLHLSVWFCGVREVGSTSPPPRRSFRNELQKSVSPGSHALLRTGDRAGPGMIKMIKNAALCRGGVGERVTARFVFLLPSVTVLAFLLVEGCLESIIYFSKTESTADVS